MQTGKKILLVDDDAGLRQALREQLKLYVEFEIWEAGSGSEALAMLKNDYFHLVVLDVDLPDMDGREVCRILRRSGVNIPIIMLTVADTETDVIFGLDAGAHFVCDGSHVVERGHRLDFAIDDMLRGNEERESALFNCAVYLLDTAGNARTRHRVQHAEADPVATEGRKCLPNLPPLPHRFLCLLRVSVTDCEIFVPALTSTGKGAANGVP